MAIWIGPERILLYNQGYVPLLGSARHPWALGRPAREVWPELWERLGPVLDRVIEHGESIRCDDADFCLDQGSREEAFFTCSFAPIRGTQEEIIGAFSVLQETTERVRSTSQREAFLSFAPATLRAGAWDQGLLPAWTYDTFLEHVLPEDREHVERTFRRAMDTGDDWSVECRIRRADGDLRWIWVSGRPVVDPVNPRRQLSGIVQDITERKRAEEALQISEARLKFAQDAAGAGIWHWDLVTGQWHWSDQLYRLFGWDPKTSPPVTIDAWRTALHPDDQVRAETNLMRALTEGTPVANEDRIVLPSGEVRWVNALGRTTYNAEGKPLYVSGICVDITERKRTEESLRISEERFAKAFYGSTAAMTLTSLEDGRLLEINDSFVEMSGFSREEAVGRTTTELRIWKHPQDQAHFVTALQRDGKVRGEYSFVRPDGEEWTAAVSAQVLELAGRPTGISSLIDVTAQKQTEEALRTSEAIARQRLAELEAIYETAPIGLCVFDENLRWIRLNRLIAEINGRAIEDHIGRTPIEIVPDVGAQAEEALRTIIRTGERLDFEMSGTTAAQPGVERYWSEHWVPMKDPDGRIVGISVAAEEITDRKRAAEALRESEATLREADRRKDEFLAWLSHELRNPLSVIRGSLAIIGRAGLDSEIAKRAWPGLNRQAALMARLLDDLLDVTRISKGKIQLKPERVALTELVRTIGEDHREAFNRQEICFEVRVPDEPLHAQVDRARISQVVGNLLQNAAKFTPAQGHVFLSLTSAADAHAIIEVRDDGAGIRQELLDKVFQPLIQDERTISQTRGGLGLGLALVKGLVELHGGTVSASSGGPSRGSVFTVTLPLSATI